MVELKQNNIVDIIDIDQRHYKAIKEILARFLPYKKVLAYGSRVKWNASDTSDLDLVVFNATQKEIYEAKEAFDESNIPFIIQLLNGYNIPNDFKENIEKKYHILQKEDDWGIFKLGDVADVRDGTHDSPKQKEQGKFLITSKHIKNNKIDFSNAYKISLEDFDAVNKRSKVDQWDILFSMIGTIGEMTIVSDDSPDFAIKNIGLFKTGDKELSQWIYYYLQSTQGKNEINASLKGSTQQYITLGDLRNFPIHLPPLPEQKAIAKILSSLDDKIDLLNRQNKTLENLAETLFRHYFIDNAKDDWEESFLSNIANFLNGLACQKYRPENDIDKLQVLKIKELSNGISDSSDWVRSDVKQEYIVKNGDVIFSWSASLMVKIWNGEKCVLNQHLFKVTSTDYPKWFYLMWCKHHLDKFISISLSHATTMGHIKRGDLDSAKVLIPNERELKIISAKMTPLIERQIHNESQIQTLEKLRDTLLPKLISGEIRVQYEEV